MNNWMKEFLSEFPNATERHTGMRQRLDLVESLVSEARRSREVTVETLRILENNEHWTYPAWWPFLSRILESPITLPPDFISLPAKITRSGRQIEMKMMLSSAVIRATCSKTWEGGGISATNVNFRYRMIRKVYEVDSLL